MDEVMLKEINGTYPGKISCDRNKRFCTCDTNYTRYDNPCVVPSVGYNYSFQKTLFLEIEKWEELSKILDFVAIRNIGIYLDGEVPCGIKVLVSANTFSIDKYVEAKGVVGVTGYKIPNPIDLGNFDKNRPLIIDSNRYTGNFRSVAFLIQIEIATDAMQGEIKIPDMKFTVDIEKEEKFCKNCINCFGSDFYTGLTNCHRLGYQKDLVTGIKKDIILECGMERYCGECGKNGKFFVKKKKN